MYVCHAKYCALGYNSLLPPNNILSTVSLISRDIGEFQRVTYKTVMETLVSLENALYHKQQVYHIHESASHTLKTLA